MFNRIALLAAAGTAGGSLRLQSRACSARHRRGARRRCHAWTRAPAGTVTVANMAATTSWLAEEKLIPDDPVLALVNNGARDADTIGGRRSRSATPPTAACPMHLGKQPATRVGQSATFKLRAGAGARDIEGKFQANRRSPDADFVFPITVGRPAGDGPARHGLARERPGRSAVGAGEERRRDAGAGQVCRLAEELLDGGDATSSNYCNPK